MKAAIELPPKLAATKPQTSSTTVGLVISRFSTAPSEGASLEGTTPSTWPRAGSLRVNLARIASSTPGTPSTMKATRQLKAVASQPPRMAPSMIPKGTPAK